MIIVSLGTGNNRYTFIYFIEKWFWYVRIVYIYLVLYKKKSTWKCLFYFYYIFFILSSFKYALLNSNLFSSDPLSWPVFFGAIKTLYTLKIK